MKQSKSSQQFSRCVIADDVRAIRVQLRKWMEELGFLVTESACGATALSAVQETQPSIVITDIDMPHSSGLHLIENLRADPDTAIANVPVIVMSSLVDAGIDQMVEQFGGSLFLSKPISKQRLVDCVNAFATGEAVEGKSHGTTPYQISPRFRRIVSGLSDRR